MTIDPSQNVGIGTSTPTAPLHIEGGTNSEVLKIEADSNPFIRWVENGTDVGFLQFLGDNAYLSNMSNGSLFIRTNNTDKMTILSGGNVGIGTTSPDLKLDVTHATAGEYVATFQNTGSNLELKLGVTSTGYLNIQGQQINNSATFNMSLQADGGNVGINTTIPTQKLHVVGNARVTGAYYDSNNSPGTANQVLVSTVTGTDWIDGSAIPGVPAGSGTLNTVAMWTPDGDTLGDSPITISSNDIISSGRGVIENTTNLTTGVVDSLLIKTLSSGTTITNGFGGGLSFYLENTVYSAVNEVGKIAVIETDTIAIDDKMVFSVKDNNILAERLTLTGSEAVFTGNVGIGITSPGDKLHVEGGIIIQNGNNLQWGGLYSAGAPTIYASTNYLHFVPTGTTGSGYRQMRLDIIGLGIGTSSPSEKLDVAGNIKIQAALLSNQENTDVDTGTETVASVAIATYTAAFFDFVIKKTTNVRSGTVYACHDGTNVEFTETSTQDLGDTSDVTLSVDISGGNMRLRATTTSDDWSVKSLIRAI